MCWSVVFFSLAYWGIKNIGKRKWGSTWSTGYSLQDKQIVVLNVVLWIWSCSSLNLSHMWHVILIYDLLQSWCKEIWYRFAYLPLYISLGMESPCLPCWVPDQVLWTADSDCSLFGAGVLKIGLKSIFFSVSAMHFLLIWLYPALTC